MMEPRPYETSYTTLTNAFDPNKQQQQEHHPVSYPDQNYSPQETPPGYYQESPPKQQQIIYVTAPDNLQQNSEIAKPSQNEDLDIIANLIAKDSLFLKNNFGSNIGESSSSSQSQGNEHHQILNHSIHQQSASQNSTFTGTPQSAASSSSNPGEANNKNQKMHTLQTSQQMHHLHSQQQQQQQQQQPCSQQQPQTSQPQHSQQPQHPQGIFHGMYHPGFDMSNIFQMSQINGHLQSMPQMTISFANNGAPTMVSHLPTHIQVPLPPPSTSTVVVNAAASATSSTSTPNRQNSSGSNNGSASSAASTSRSRNRNSSDGNMAKCNFCPKKVPANMADVHRSECRMIRGHECPQCGKRFKARGGLQQHSRIHLQERAYCCKFCPKRFTQKSHLDQHERIHTGAKPFVCQFCGRGFRQRSQQIGHESTHPAGAIAVAATSNSLNSTNSSGIFSVNTTGSDQSSMSDNSCDTSPASSALPMQSHQSKVLQMAQNHNAAMLHMLNNSTPTNNSQLLNLITN